MSPDEENPEDPAPQTPDEPSAENTPAHEPVPEPELSSFSAEPPREEENAPEEIVAAPEEIEEPEEFDEPEPVIAAPPPIQRRPPPAREAPRQEPRQEQSPFGEAEIPMPRGQSRGDKRRARDQRVNLDLDLDRIKRRKRYGFLLTTFTVLFVAFVLAPVTWVGLYLFVDPPATMLMMQRAAEGEQIAYHPTRINRMSPHLARSVIAAEDANFCTHDGFDVAAIQDAMRANARGGRVRGASTISQQVAKNVFLWPERSWLRKGMETYFTALIEFMWPKRRIMEVYLNVAEWGDGNFGVEAASRARFGVAAADLTPLQAARLAAVLPSPNRWRADNPGPYVRRRSATIVQRARVVRNEHMAACVLQLDRPD